MCTHSQLYIFPLRFLPFFVFHSVPFPSPPSFIPSFPSFFSPSLLSPFLCVFFLSELRLAPKQHFLQFPGLNLEEDVMCLILVHNYPEIIAIWGPNFKWDWVLRDSLPLFRPALDLLALSCQIPFEVQFLGIGKCPQDKSHLVLLRYSFSLSGFQLYPHLQHF